MPWTQIELAAAELGNADESALRGQTAAHENCYVSDAKSLTRFPGLRSFLSTGGTTDLVLANFRDDMVAVDRGGQVYRIRQDGTFENVTGVPMIGTGRPVFAETESELLIAAGGPVIRLAGEKTDLLANAPETTHIAYISGYVVAIEAGSGRFRHSKPGQYDKWDALDTFAAEGKPDNLVAAMVSPFNELLLVGSESIEQFDLSGSATRPFFRRWMIGDGVSAPYTLVAADNGIWGVNNDREFVTFRGQDAVPSSEAIQASLEAIDNWDEAWAAHLIINGQRMMLLQAPRATNRYGTQGITLILDYRKRRWASLFGWDEGRSIQSGWPGRSYLKLWDRHFVGGQGMVWELDADTFTAGGMRLPVLYRSGHLDRTGGGIWSPRARIRMKRGGGGTLSIRVRKDGKPFGRWRRIPLGRTGQTRQWIEFGGWGEADSLQFEFLVTDAVAFDVLDFQIETIGIE